MRNRITCTVKQGRGRTIEKPVKNELDGPEPAQTVECSRAVPEHSCVRQRCCAITPVTPPFSELRGAFTGRSSGRSARKGLLLVASLAPASPPLVVPSRPSHTLVAPPAAGRRHLVEVGAWQQEEDGGEGQGGGCGGVYVTVTHMASERGGHSRRLLLGTPSPPSSILQREVRSNRTQCWHPVPSPVLRRPRPPPSPSSPLPPPPPPQRTPVATGPLPQAPQAQRGQYQSPSGMPARPAHAAWAPRGQASHSTSSPSAWHTKHASPASAEAAAAAAAAAASSRAAAASACWRGGRRGGRQREGQQRQ